MFMHLSSECGLVMYYPSISQNSCIGRLLFIIRHMSYFLWPLEGPDKKRKQALDNKYDKMAARGGNKQQKSNKMMCQISTYSAGGGNKTRISMWVWVCLPQSSQLFLER